MLIIIIGLAHIHIDGCTHTPICAFLVFRHRFSSPLVSQLFIYSSGSIHAQKNLFSHPKGHASFLPLISDHFDTTIGGKREAKSYTKIAEKIAVSPKNIMFLTDIYEEAVAADEAGFRTYLLHAVMPIARLFI